MSEMRQVFFSYGHDKNKVLVEKFAEDLPQLFPEDAPLKVWIDKTEIREHEHWRRKIDEGIKKSQFVFAFASEYAFRQGGVCRDELSIAMNVSYAPVQTILVEKDVTVPSSLREKQDIDMSDWKGHWDEKTNTFDKAWYDAQLRRLAAAIKDPELENYAEEVRFVQEMLRPNTLDLVEAFVDETPFYGREWLYESVNHWVENDTDRVLWITGGSGTGKSAVVSRSSLFVKNVVATIYCNAETAMNTQDSFIRLLIFRLCQKLPDYRKTVYDRIKADPSVLSDANTTRNHLLLEPLMHLIDGTRSQMVIMIDGLDEADTLSEDEEVENPIVELITGSVFEQLPQYLRIVATSRPQTAEHYHATDRISIEQDDAHNREDIRLFLNKELSKYQEELGKKVFQHNIETVCEKSEGIFLYAKMVTDDIKKGKLSFTEDLDHLPKGLFGYYDREFARLFKHVKDEKFQEIYFEPMAILAAVPEGIPEVTLRRACQADDRRSWDRRRELRFYEKLTSFIKRDQGSVRYFHKSLRDWLVSDGVDGRFGMDEEDFCRVKQNIAKGAFDVVCYEMEEANDYEILALPVLLWDPKGWKKRAEQKERDELLTELSDHADYIDLLTRQIKEALRSYDFDKLRKYTEALDVIISCREKKQLTKATGVIGETEELNHKLIYWLAKGRICEQGNALEQASAWYAKLAEITPELRNRLDHENVLLLWHRAAVCEFRLNNLVKAAAFYREQIIFLEENKAGDSSEWLNAQIALIGVLRADSKYKDALEIARNLKEEHQTLLTRYPELTYQLYRMEAWTHRSNQNMEKAEQVLAMAEDLRRSGVMPDQNDVANAKYLQAAVMLHALSFDRALKLIEEAEEIYAVIHGKAGLEIPDFYDRHGEIFERMGKIASVEGDVANAATYFSKAEEQYQKGYQNRKAGYTEANLYMNFSYHHLIGLYLFQNTKLDEVRKMIREELAITKAVEQTGKVSEKRIRQEYSRIAREAVLLRATSEVGYLEKSKKAYRADPSCLDDPTVGAGEDNYTKYGRDMHAISPKIMDFPAPWCDAFVDWCFYKTFGVERARALLGDFDDFTVQSAKYFMDRGQWYTEPKVGTQIFFRNEKRICHTGLVVDYDRKYVYTVEGNTSDGKDVIPNGGGVVKKFFLVKDARIEGYGGFAYDTVRPEEIQV